jgi:hypothetical protein
MFSSFATQQAGLITDSLYLNLDAANYVNNLASPLNIGTTLQDQYTGFTNNTLVKSGSLAMDKNRPASIDFVAANTTGSILLPDQNVTGRTFLVNSSWTIQWWGFWDVIAGRDVCLFSQGNPANNNGLHIQARNSKLQFAMFNSDLTSTANLTTGVWRHFACVFQNGSQFGFRKVIYFNGVQDSTQTFATAYGGGDVGDPFAIGTNIWGGTIGQGSVGYDGKIGEVQIYGRALNASEVFQNYQATKNKYNIFT